MLLRILAVVLIASPTWGEEGFRISKVVPGERPGVSRFEFKPSGKEPEAIFAEDRPIITSADVESSFVDPVSEGTLSFQLRDEGVKKIEAATANPANLRLALIVDGRVLMAPVVRGALGRNFQISGLKGLSEDELWSYALTIEGKSKAEVEAGVEEMRKHREELAKMPREEPIYYSEEEYAQLKAAREKAGIYFSDEIPTKASLDKNLRKGMTETEVIGIYGKPRWRKRNADDSTISFTYELADERRPMERKMVPQKFSVNFENGKVTGWKLVSYGDTPRSPKQPQQKPSRFVYPAYDPSDENLDVVKVFEATKISGDRMKLSLAEAGELLAGLYMLSKPGVSPHDAIAANCDVMIAMAANFPEVKELLDNSPDGKVSLAKLHEVLEPYSMGKKEFPEHLLKAVE